MNKGKAEYIAGLVRSKFSTVTSNIEHPREDPEDCNLTFFVNNIHKETTELLNAICVTNNLWWYGFPRDNSIKIIIKEAQLPHSRAEESRIRYKKGKLLVN